jgi:4-amino-4-deoxy-L-arabinose transferase-like glycosyltransferase
MADQPPQSPRAGWRLSLVLPAYNEQAGIRQAIVEADEALAAITHEYEILVVDDGSSDATAAVVLARAADRPHVRLLRHRRNRGYGAALRTGFEAARFDRVAFTDADCQFHLTDLASLLPLTDEHPLAVGYRVDRQDPWQRRFFSWGYNTLVRTLLGTRVRDCDCALKVFRRDALAHLLPETPGFFVNTEMLTRARQHGFDVAEAGVRHRPRLRGVSKVSLSDIPRTLRTLLPFWWSQVLFPGGSRTALPSRPDSSGVPSYGRTLLAGAIAPVATLLLLGVLLFFGRLHTPLQEPDEVRYAEIPRQMLAEGRWLVPVLHGLPYYDKPPLLYWLVMASYRVFGVEDWAARLIPSTAALLVVLVTYFWGRRTLGPRAAFAAALVLCLSARFVYLGRLLTMDSLLCLWVVASLASAHLAVAGARLRWGWWLASAAACGLGLLTKGPVALALSAAPLLALQGLDPRTARPGWRGWAAYVALALGLSAPWYAGMAAAEPAFVEAFFWKHNVVRYVAPFDHAKPAWFHLPGLLVGTLPWTLLLPGLVRFLTKQSVSDAARRPVALGFYLLAFLWCVAFYSLAGCKRPVYILPALPLLALMLGCYLDVLLPRERLAGVGAGFFRHGSLLAQRATLLVLGLAAGCSLLTIPAGLLTRAGGLSLAGIAATAFLAVWQFGQPGRRAVSWGACAALTFAVLLAGVNYLLPPYARKFSLRHSVRPQAALCADPGVPVICYPHRWDSVSFYLRRDDVRVYTANQKGELLEQLRRAPNTVLIVKSERYLEELLEQMPGSLEFVPRGRRGMVTVGVVRPRTVAPETLWAARRDDDWSPPGGSR